MEEKNMSNRSAKDVISRTKRVGKIIASQNITGKTLEELQSNPDYLRLSVFVKSQLKRATMLFLEYEELNNG